MPHFKPGPVGSSGSPGMGFKFSMLVCAFSLFLFPLSLMNSDGTSAWGQEARQYPVIASQTFVGKLLLYNCLVLFSTCLFPQPPITLGQFVPFGRFSEPL